MIIGVPKEIKEQEYRVGMLPSGVETLVKQGHQVVVEKNAGEGSGIVDGEYLHAGALLADKASDVFEQADMIIKVKEPQESEIACLKDNQVVFTYFHLAADRELTEGLLKRKITAVAYETIQLPNGGLPLLTPMSEIAGRLAVLEGAKHSEKPFGGQGILLGGVPGVPPAEVVILGGGSVGKNAAKMAAGLGANVSVLDVNIDRLRYLDDIMPSNVRTVFSDPHTIRNAIQKADLLIGAVLIVGAKAPVLVNREMIKTMKPGSVIVDVAVDQGGCVETCHPTTHNNPTYLVDGVVHYCVANMPGAVARTATYALCNASLPYAVALATKGFQKAMKEDHSLAKGLNMIEGKLTIREVSEAFNIPYVDRNSVLGIA